MTLYAGSILGLTGIDTYTDVDSRISFHSDPAMAPLAHIFHAEIDVATTYIIDAHIGKDPLYLRTNLDVTSINVTDDQYPIYRIQCTPINADIITTTATNQHIVHDDDMIELFIGGTRFPAASRYKLDYYANDTSVRLSLGALMKLNNPLPPSY